MSDPTAVDLTPEQARTLTDEIRVQADILVPLVVEAYRGRAWRALGYESWDAYRAAEFPAVRVAIEQRPEYARELRDAGMSQRQIGDVLGVGETTVRRDIDSRETDPPNGGSDGQTLMSGGRAYTRSRPAPEPDPLPEPIAEQIGQRIAERARPEPIPYTGLPPQKREPVMLTLRTHTGEDIQYPQPVSKPTFNETTGEGISWAAWSWNPVTGCLHGCNYCYARAIIHRYPDANPAGFTPLFHEERLDAPSNTTIPAAHRDDPAYRRVFVCSMADLYGRWVPLDWIDAVHKRMLANPQWEYLLLTKFPDRYVEVELPPTAWVGTSVDEQKRVRIAERAFRRIEGVKVKWLSLEPLKEPLEFKDLSMFDWVVIGAQTATNQPDGPVGAFAPPFEWVARLVAQARESGCRIHLKPNLANGRPGMTLPDEYPDGAA